MIKIKKLAFSYHRFRTNELRIDHLLLDQNLVLIIGKSGSYKSTLGKLIGGRLRPKRGRIVAKDAFYLSQFYSFMANKSVDDHLKIIDNSDHDKELQKLNLLDLKYADVSTLSEGQKARLAFLLASITPAPILVLDEPTQNLDSKNAAIVEEMIVELSKSRQVVVLTHSDNFANISHQQVFIDDGRIDKESKIGESLQIKAKPAKRRIKPLNLLDSPKSRRLFSLSSIFICLLSATPICSFKKTEQSDLYSDYTYRVNLNTRYTLGIVGISPDRYEVAKDVLTDISIDFFPLLRDSTHLTNPLLPDFDENSNELFTGLHITYHHEIKQGEYSISSSTIKRIVNGTNFETTYKDGGKTNDYELKIFDSRKLAYKKIDGLNPLFLYVSFADYLSIALQEEGRIEVNNELPIESVKLSEDYANANNLTIGDTLRINRQDFTFVGFSPNADIEISSDSITLNQFVNGQDQYFISLGETEKKVLRSYSCDLSEPRLELNNYALMWQNKSILILLICFSIVLIASCLILVFLFFFKTSIKSKIEYLSFIERKKDRLLPLKSLLKSTIYLLPFSLIISAPLSLLLNFLLFRTLYYPLFFVLLAVAISFAIYTLLFIFMFLYIIILRSLRKSSLNQTEV